MSRKPKKPGRAKSRIRVRHETVVPPEGVPLKFEVAALGARFASQIVDILLTAGSLILLFLVLAGLGVRFSGLGGGIFMLLYFFIRTPYYVVAELIWNGQTLGKRITQLRVISGNGQSLRPYQIVLRNLMREVEVFVPGTILFATAGNENWIERILIILWVAVVLAVPLLNRRRQRLGDLTANTLVIHQPRQTLLDEQAQRDGLTEQTGIVFLPGQLDHYGAYELQVLERVLQVKRTAATNDRHMTNMCEIGERIRNKIGYTETVAPKDEEVFLRTFYTVQRAFLEQKKLFGEARVDKFHAATDVVETARTDRKT